MMTPENRAVYEADPNLCRAAYADIKIRYDLTAAQRDQLDASPLYSDILHNAHLGRWERVLPLLARAGIIT